MKDIASKLTTVKALEAHVVNDDTEGTGESISLAGFEAAMFAYVIGTSADSLSGSVKWDFRLEHADDDGAGSPDSWAAVTSAADVQGATPNSSTGNFLTIDAAAEDDIAGQIGYVGGKEWVRFVADATGSHSSGTPMAAVCIKGHARHLGL